MADLELKTRWLCTMHGTIPEAKMPLDNLMVFNVETAWIESPRFNAKLIGPGGDWIRLQPNGNWKLDVRLLFEADDGSAVHCFYNGVLRMDQGLAERLESGDEIDGNDMYFRATPYFETQSDKYAWLNDIATIGSMRSFGGGRVVYDIFEVL
ncbi:MAG: hypothetical protein ACI8RN_000733 [Glaciecola sp.]|jgi:hypothetical protein|uniref:DUF3237 domain-containing protein n=1 Tax=Congregibacter sp. TaxID=2744308 RepID=UPI0039E62A5F